MAEGGSSNMETKNMNKEDLMTCSNPVCGAKTESCSIAPFFVCAYFNLQTRKSKRQKIVCKTCYSEAENHQNALVEMLKQEEVVFGFRKQENLSDVVTIDEESSEEEEQESAEKVEIEDGFEDVLKSVMNKYKFEEQAHAACTHLSKKWSKTKEGIFCLDESLEKLQKEVDSLRYDLYSTFGPIKEEIDSVDVDEVGNVSPHMPSLTSSKLPHQHRSISKKADLPPLGRFIHAPLSIGQAVYAMRDTLLASWGRGCVAKVLERNKWYLINFDSLRKNPSNLSPKFLAYVTPSPVQFTVGARVIAKYVGEKDGNFEPNFFYAAVVVEAPKHLNQQRYLVFFDQGYAQYCTHEQLRMVCYSSRDVWHDVYPKSRDFISTYIKSFPERVMVKLQTGHTIITELEGCWYHGLVESVDGSLTKIYIVAKNHHEWIYRGSTRLRPLFDILVKAEARKKQGATRPAHNRTLSHMKKNGPYVEYTREDSDPSPQTPSSYFSTSSESYFSSGDEARNISKPTARKSTSKIRSVSSTPSPRHDYSNKSLEHRGQLKQRLNESHIIVNFEPHQCRQKCIENFTYSTGDCKNENPLLIPMLKGWDREVIKKRNGKLPIVIYRAPCGRRMRNMDEVHRFLRLTGSKLGIDLFCFESRVECFKEFEPENINIFLKDITDGKENVQLSSVNSVDHTNPPSVKYSTERIPRKGVDINTDPDFLVCCDCTDDCQNKEACQCWQLTIQATARGPGGKINQEAGYNNRRLMEKVVTGIYECNRRCKCRDTCLNRVAQWPLQLRLQLFRTEKRGWGIRCLDDIPQGQFICIYTGEVLTEHEANEDGKQFGDEYFADLDLIEMVEQAKEGYESDVDEIDQPSGGAFDSSSLESDSGSTSDTSRNLRNPSARWRKEEISRSAKNVPSVDRVVKESSDEKESTRKLFGPDESTFVIDAKNIGNIGRYFNHSCNPNTEVQNIFVDTQDLRFPWLGFFSLAYIEAGTELTWNYNYEIDSVPGKKLLCHCGAKDCKGRLI